MHIPTIGGMVISVPVQLLLLAALGYHIFSDLRRDCSKPVTLAALLAGLIGGVSLRLVMLLIADNRVYGNACRTLYNNVFPDVVWSKDLPDAIWVAAELMQSGGFLFCGGMGLILMWLATRVCVRGTRVGKITTLGIVLIVALSLSWVWIAPHFSSRYQAEDETLASLASRLDKPIKYSRIEGWPGLQYVNYLYLPHCTIADGQIDAIIAQLRRFPRLTAVEIHSVTMSEHGLERLRNALPYVAFGNASYAASEATMEMLPKTGQPP